MSTPAQIFANQANAQKSSGPTSETGKETSARNRFVHGLSAPANSFFILASEDEIQFDALKLRLKHEHQPQAETERILVRRMAESEWLRLRAIRLQYFCHDHVTGLVVLEKQFALYLRYQTTQERSFYKALNELQKLRNEKRKEQIGFESQKRAVEVHDLKKEVHDWKKQLFELKKTTLETKKARTTSAPNPESSLETLKTAA